MLDIYLPPALKDQFNERKMGENMPKKLKPTDGLGPKEIKNIRTALRLVWQRSHSRKLVVTRCTGKDGFTKCEKCKKKTPKLKVDHILACGDVDGGYITRLFTPSKNLQGLCHECHKVKTKEERRQKIKPNLDYAVYTAKEDDNFY